MKWPDRAETGRIQFEYDQISRWVLLGPHDLYCATQERAPHDDLRGWKCADAVRGCEEDVALPKCKTATKERQRAVR